MSNVPILSVTHIPFLTLNYSGWVQLQRESIRNWVEFLSIYFLRLIYPCRLYFVTYSLHLCITFSMLIHGALGHILDHRSLICWWRFRMTRLPEQIGLPAPLELTIESSNFGCHLGWSWYLSVSKLFDSISLGESGWRCGRKRLRCVNYTWRSCWEVGNGF